MKKIFTTLLALAAFSAADAQYSLNYKLDGNVGDSTGNSYHGTDHNLTYTADIAGLPNRAGQFNGTSTYVEVPNSWIGGQKIMVSVWFKTDANKKPAGIAYTGSQSIGLSPTNFTPILWIDSAGKLSGIMYDGSASCMRSTDTVNDNKWHHAVFYFEVYGPGTLHQLLWLDGKIADERTGLIGGAPIYTYFYLGACNARNYNNLPDVWFYFKGALDNFITLAGAAGNATFHNLDLAITEHPQNQFIVSGMSGNVHVSHTKFRSDSTYTYKWYKDGVLLTGKTDSVITIASMSNADTGTYYCEVTNTNTYTVTSEKGRLSMAPVGISAVNTESAVKLYPNPATNTLNIVVGNKAISEVAVYSLDGRLIKQIKQAGINTIDVSLLRPGMYSLKVFCGDEVFTSRFIKE